MHVADEVDLVHAWHVAGVACGHSIQVITTSEKVLVADSVKPKRDAGETSYNAPSWQCTVRCAMYVTHMVFHATTYTRSINAVGRHHRRPQTGSSPALIHI